MVNTAEKGNLKYAGSRPCSWKPPLRFALHDPMNAGVADLQLGSNGPGGHAARRHPTDLLPVQNEPLAPKMIRASLTLETCIGGAGTLRPANRFLFCENRQEADYDLTEHPGAVNVLLRETFPLDAVIGQLAKVLQRVRRTLSGKSVQSP